MFQLLRLEFVKAMRSRFIFILLTVVFIATCSLFSYINKKEMPLSRAEEIVKINYDMNKEGYERVAPEAKELEAKGERLPDQLKREYEMYSRGYYSYDKAYEGIQNRDWSLYLRGEIEAVEKIEEDEKRELEHVAKSYIWPTPFTFLSGMDKMRWMEERNIRPIFPVYNTSWLTIYDEEFDDPMIKQIVMESSDLHSAAGFNFAHKLFEYGFSIVGIVFFIFIFGDILTREGFGKNGPIQMIRTQPIHRWKFWLSKYVTVIGGATLIILLYAIIALLLGLVFNRLGDWNYPILIYGENRTYSFLPVALFIAKAFSLFIALLALSFSLLFLFSIISNRAIFAIGLTIVALFAGQIIAEQSTLLSWSHWIPFHYFDIYKVINGEQAVLTNNVLYSYKNALISTSIVTCIVLLITFVIGKLRKGVIS